MRKRCGIGSASGNPLPPHTVIGQVGIHQRIPKPLCTATPINQQVFDQERPDDHPHSIVHPTGFPQLTHTCIHQADIQSALSAKHAVHLGLRTVEKRQTARAADADLSGENGIEDDEKTLANPVRVKKKRPLLRAPRAAPKRFGADLSRQSAGGETSSMSTALPGDRAPRHTGARIPTESALMRLGLPRNPGCHSALSPVAQSRLGSRLSADSARPSAGSKEMGERLEQNRAVVYPLPADSASKTA